MTTLRRAAIATFGTDGLSQAPHLTNHLIRFRASKAENEALADIRTRIGSGKGPQPKAFLRGPSRNLLVRQPRRERDDQVHARFRAQDLDLGAELLPQGSHER